MGHLGLGQTVIVIGAGITGLSCAWRLKKLGIDALVLESSPRAGGVIQSERVGEYLIEHGPNSLLPLSENFGLLDETGLTEQLIEGDRRAPRYVCIGGSLRKVPLGPMTITGVVRATAEPFVRSQSAPDESIHDFFVRRFGKQTEQRLVSPFVTGIYAGNTRELSMSAAFPKLVELERQHGSLILGMLTSRKPKATRKGHTCSFAEGMETLPRRLAAECDIALNATSIVLEPDLTVRWNDQRARPKAVVITVPAPQAAELLRNRIPAAADLLNRMDYAPMVIATTSIADSAFKQPLRGFGFLVPRTEKLHLLGTLFSSALFPGRAPAGRQLLTSFIGGALERAAIDWPDDRVWEIVRSELQTVLKTSSTPEPMRIVRRPRALPQYKIGHGKLSESIKLEVRASPGVFLAGNYMDGIAVGACIETGERTAREVAAFVGSNA